MANEPIPLEDDGQNDSSHSDWLIPLESDGGADAKEPLGVPGEELASRITAISSDPGVRSPRKEARKAIDGVWVLFEPDASCGGSMQVECPLVDISIAGFSVVYDKPIRAGLKGYVSNAIKLALESP